MKLAEALSLRADLEKRFAQLKERMKNNSKIQESNEPAENLNELYDELRRKLVELEALIYRINVSNVRLFPMSDFGDATKRLIEKFSQERYDDGGVQFHKFKIEIKDENFRDCLLGGGLPGYDFPEQIVYHNDLADYRENLEIQDQEIDIPHKYPPDPYWKSLFLLPGILAESASIRRAYSSHRGYSLPADLAWEVAVDFVKEAFQNRFDEVIWYNNIRIINSSNWFRYKLNVYSIFILDKKKHEITIIDLMDDD